MQKQLLLFHNAVAGYFSVPRDLPGGNPQGSTFGLLGFKSSSNDNADHVAVDRRFKFVDDLSMLEILNLLTVGLVNYNFQDHVASDVGIDQKFLLPQNFDGQDSLAKIEEWTRKNKTLLNTKKSNYMIFNFSDNHRFATRMYLEDNILENVGETKLLGTIVSSDLKWTKNTEMLIKKAYQRMQMLHKLKSFNVANKDLVTIYILYIRSIIEQSCQVWHYSLTEEESNSLERVQKVACSIILSQEYTSYSNALRTLNLDTLSKRREKLCLKFAEACVKHPKMSKLFPYNQTISRDLIHREKFYVQPARTGRLLNSTIPQLQRALNRAVKMKQTQ